VVSGRRTFEEAHIPGAGFLDLQGEFSDTSTPLRFMMPPMSQLEAAFGRHGVVLGVAFLIVNIMFLALYALASRAGRILSREQLIELAGGKREESFERSIDVHVSRLRHKLGDNPRRPRFLKTVRGAGYILTAEAGR